MIAARAAGFTLVELAVVVTLLALLAWLAFPSTGALGEIRLAAASRRVASDLRYAQNLSLGSRVAHGVRFDADADRYVVFAGGSAAAASAVVNPADRGRTLDVSLAALPETRGVRVESARFGGGSAVSFDSYGVPRDGAGAELRAPGRVVLRFGDRRDTLEVAPMTGAIRVP